MKRTVSYSQLNTFKRCRQKWYYNYVRGLVPKKRVAKIELGKYGHALLEAYYRGEDLEQASEEYWQENTEGMFDEELIEFQEVKEDAEYLVNRYIKHYEHLKDEYIIHSVEGKFRVPILTPQGNRSMTDFRGIFDLIVEDSSGGIWLVDHKFTSIDLDKYAENLVLDEQANYYLWALSQILGADVIEGIIFNLIRSKLPTIPRVLKNGELSKAKNIDTDVETYLQAIKDNNLDVNDYRDILEEIKQRDRAFFKRHKIYRTQEELDCIGRELYIISIDMRDNNIYRNATRDCSWDCPYRELCIMEQKGIKDDFYIKLNFTEYEG